MRLRGRGPRDAPASSAGAGDARRLAPPGRNPFVHELRLSALQKAQVGARRPAPGPGRAGGRGARRGGVWGGVLRRGPAGLRPLRPPAAPALPCGPHPAGRVPAALTPSLVSLLSRRPCPKPGSSPFPGPPHPEPGPAPSFSDLRTPFPDLRTPALLPAPSPPLGPCSSVPGPVVQGRGLQALRGAGVHPPGCDCPLMSFLCGDLGDHLSQCQR